MNNMSVVLIICIFIVSIIITIIWFNSAKIKGSIGEFRVDLKLMNLGSDYIIMNDIMIRNSKGTTSQIDHLILSEYGIFVIETKNYKGWIFGDEKSDEWLQTIYKKKYSFRNPVKQNWSHVYALKHVLSDFPNTKYQPIVVFAGTATLKHIISSVPVIYENSLKKTIKKYCIEKCLSNDDVLKIKDTLETSQIKERSSKKEHIENIRNSINERQTKINNLTCPRCNGKLKLRNGRNGKFYGCSNYPKCKFTTNIHK